MTPYVRYLDRHFELHHLSHTHAHTRILLWRFFRSKAEHSVELQGSKRMRLLGSVACVMQCVCVCLYLALMSHLIRRGHFRCVTVVKKKALTQGTLASRANGAFQSTPAVRSPSRIVKSMTAANDARTASNHRLSTGLSKVRTQDQSKPVLTVIVEPSIRTCSYSTFLRVGEKSIPNRPPRKTVHTEPT